MRLAKTGQKSNWARRPLSDAQLSYASDDTRYLEALADLLAAELETRGRAEWHAEMCGRVVDATGQEVERDTQNAWRVKGISELDRRQLAYVREIWKWRDKEAMHADLPSFKILGNKQIAELAVWAASHKGKPLSKGPSLPRNCVGKRLKALERAVQKAEAMPKDKWPPLRKESPRRRSGPDRKAHIEALRRECAKAAHDLEIEASVLAPRATLAQVARADARTPQAMRDSSPMMDWQIEILGDRIRKVLESFDR